MPVVGVLDGGSSDRVREYLAPFRQGLGEAGYVEGQNVAIEYRWAEGHYDRFPELAAGLVRSQVSVIAVPASTPASLADEGVRREARLLQSDRAGWIPARSAASDLLSKP
jgi:hypothetical protein